MAKKKETTSTTTKTKYTPAQKQAYHNQQSKPGATKNVYDKTTGVVVVKKLSDFERGRHKEKADTIVKARKRAYRKYNKGK